MLNRSQMSDEQLVEAFQAGHVAAYDELVSRWQSKIRGAVWRVLGSTEDAADITQEAFLRAFRGLKAFKREAKFSSWIYQIALNLCRDSLRRKKGKSYVSLDDGAVRGGRQALGQVARGFAERHHAWDQAFDGIFAVYRSLLASGR